MIKKISIFVSIFFVFIITTLFFYTEYKLRFIKSNTIKINILKISIMSYYNHFALEDAIASTQNNVAKLPQNERVDYYIGLVYANIKLFNSLAYLPVIFFESMKPSDRILFAKKMQELKESKYFYRLKPANKNTIQLLMETNKHYE